MSKLFFSLGAILGGCAVILGAWASHRGIDLLSSEQVHLIQKGLRYQMYHGLALLAVAWAVEQWPAAAMFTGTGGGGIAAGVVLFSGSLYLKAFTVVEPGYITPLGGMLLIIGWFFLALGVWRG
ncbi:DUF423 domain-containing protein [Desulfogranum japonicum]|uniref:DUF423 domain-containing protein n=1 Tax=Desulfogranum japonicum TaxID=231447 RepID=UPI000411EB9D|nr:DUF423 domain-containing protein [Desulfogranum japonicum]